ncbi:zinc finger CCHC-type and RNA-binding motif-containing protein 1-like [Sitophilus oryzae]|uniref:Zinc finger CCHC-type and RNA-binding motif-containing protein 1 n=1 Tax=Sitophilus oryzae TaxID=7048 RepID=A0A6J2YJ18_SITOR|nr:zinc finger CCHC-type and RNA-binding motif-containing protein 1-like [Sitophilus oryzae]XP_030762866.1 zinc finger CCHC-type and RNA-binding motif-containing protein 1-like [Sitophilus oryzae]
MSGGLVPSKSTVYISNLPFDLKNNDLHKIFEKYGKIVKVTVLKDKQNRRSKGVAFVLFLSPDDAMVCVQEVNSKEMFGRTLKASIAKDNGRTREFIRRKEYPDKTKCFECGEAGHLSYSCSKNLLGNRDPPPKKVRVRKKREKLELTQEEKEYFDSSDEDNRKIEPDEESLSAAIKLEQEKHELEEYRHKVATGCYSDSEENNSTRKKIKKSSYFSDEEESD